MTAGKPANVFGLISETVGIRQDGFYTIPVNHEGFIITVIPSVESNKSIELTLRTVNAGGTGVTVDFSHIDITDQVAHLPVNTGLPSPAGTDIMFLAKLGTGTGDVNVIAELILVQV